MKRYLLLTKDVFFVFFALDVFLMLLTLGAISAGQDVQHIPFWDIQMKFVVGLLG